MTNQQSSNTSQAASDSSIDSILNDIKGVMSAKPQDEDILVLTNEVENAVPSNENAKEDPALQQRFREEDFGIKEDSDILEEIDASFQAKPSAPEQHGANSIVLGQVETNVNAELERAINSKMKEDILDSDTKETVHDLISHFYKAKKESRHSDFRSGATIEDLVLEILKPELKAWMERNIVELVQKVIEKEIRKIMADDQ
ncbi:MAG: DUF2497 domain-containing protein [Alphaproteobacteria bacterium]|jgi:cell pole-organizing protein PopZ|nr:DUF2497 domain-containing protein [Candidatus Jidaibacter sp.]